MTKQDIIDILCVLIFVCFIGTLGYGSYCYMKRVDALVDQYRIELLNK